MIYEEYIINNHITYLFWNSIFVSLIYDHIFLLLSRYIPEYVWEMILTIAVSFSSPDFRYRKQKNGWDIFLFREIIYIKK